LHGAVGVWYFTRLLTTLDPRHILYNVIITKYISEAQ
jgi:hypothetical protein